MDPKILLKKKNQLKNLKKYRDYLIQSGQNEKPITHLIKKVESREINSAEQLHSRIKEILETPSYMDQFKIDLPYIPLKITTTAEILTLPLIIVGNTSQKVPDTLSLKRVERYLVGYSKVLVACKSMLHSKYEYTTQLQTICKLLNDKSTTNYSVVFPSENTHYVYGLLVPQKIIREFQNVEQVYYYVT